MRARATLALVLSIAGACGSCDEPERSANVGALTLDVPDDWTAELQQKDPVEQLALRPPRPTVLCRVVVMRGKGDAPAPAPSDFITQTRRQFPGGTEHADMTLDSRIGTIEGKSLRDVEVPEELEELGDDLRLEVYATEHDGAMVGGVIGWFFYGEEERSKIPDELWPQRLRDDCVDALETLRTAD
ncbi:MAG: hypothetical protein ACOCUS_05780 [Polyangiales bacterium]